MEVYVSYKCACSPEIDFAVGRLKRSLESMGIDFERIESCEAREYQLSFVIDPSEDGEPNDGYEIEGGNGRLIVRSDCARGVLYGVLEIVDQLQEGRKWSEIEAKSLSAHYGFRAIKFNLPWYTYRTGEHLDLHVETCRDIKFWERFLDMLLENRFNVLSLWNMHPFIYMVVPRSYPKASPFTEEEMGEWRRLWKEIFSMARERGIDTYLVNWNIFVSAEFAKHYQGIDGYRISDYLGGGVTSPDVEQYTRELVTQTLDEYPDLTGIGLTLGERMAGMNSAERSAWVDRTIIAGMKNASRPARLIYRAPLSADNNSEGSTSTATEQIARDAIEGMELDETVWVEFKFNWSHGHTSPRLAIVHGGMLTDTYWEPYSDKYKAIWTMRNEDFFVLRWSQPDFIRTFIELNSQPYTGGCFIGSECYIPAKDYITKEGYRTWDYAFERQWLFYKVWGRLLFDTATPNSVFEEALESRFPGVDGGDLLRAWTLASNCANRLGSYYGATWDATLYSEGFAKDGGVLIGVEDLMSQGVLDDEVYQSIGDYVESGGETGGLIGPLELASMLEADSDEAMALVERARGQADSRLLEVEVNDIVCWVWLGRYFAQKLRGGVALASVRKCRRKEFQDEAICALEKAKECWLVLVEQVERYNVEEIPYQFDACYSWRKQVPLLDRDIEAARLG